jgi:hypothetical protein
VYEFERHAVGINLLSSEHAGLTQSASAAHRTGSVSCLSHPPPRPGAPRAPFVCCRQREAFVLSALLIGPGTRGLNE